MNANLNFHWVGTTGDVMCDNLINMMLGDLIRVILMFLFMPVMGFGIPELLGVAYQNVHDLLHNVMDFTTLVPEVLNRGNAPWLFNVAYYSVRPVLTWLNIYLDPIIRFNDLDDDVYDRWGDLSDMNEHLVELLRTFIERVIPLIT